jgi:hypothetical protein
MATTAAITASKGAMISKLTDAELKASTTWRVVSWPCADRLRPCPAACAPDHCLRVWCIEDEQGNVLWRAFTSRRDAEEFMKLTQQTQRTKR